MGTEWHSVPTEAVPTLTINDVMGNNFFTSLENNREENENPEAFAGYIYNFSTIRVDCEVDEFGGDNWQSPVTLDQGYVYPWETWVTYRAFGTPRQIWIQSSKIYTENGVLDPFDYRNSRGVKVCTNRNNRKDIYSSYSQYANENCKIMIQQLEP